MQKVTIVSPRNVRAREVKSRAAYQKAIIGCDR
jgi:hypothetical protein